MMRCILAFFGLVVFGNLLYAGERERVVESVLPSLDYGPSCWSTVNVQNLGDRAATVALESHRASGALIALEGLPRMALTLNPCNRSTFRLESKDQPSQ